MKKKISIFCNNKKEDKTNGFSPYTEVKQLKFLEILEAHLYHTIELCNYNYIDMTAHSGEMNGIKGSPVLAYEFLKSESMWDMNFYLFEIDPIRRKQLISQFIPKRNAKFYYFINHNNILDNIKDLNKKFRTLVYLDQCGTIPDFDFLHEIAQSPQLENADFLINFASTTPKRVYGAHKKDYKIKEGILNFPRKYKLATEPIDSHGWSFLFFTNRKLILKKFNEIGFKDVSYNESECLKQIILTKEERGYKVKSISKTTQKIIEEIESETLDLNSIEVFEPQLTIFNKIKNYFNKIKNIMRG